MNTTGKMILVLGLLLFGAGMVNAVSNYDQDWSGGGGGSVHYVNCSDSDGGHNYTVFGVVNATTSNGSIHQFLDSCASPRNLNEWYCQQARNPRQELFNCMRLGPDYGCSDGYCKMNSSVPKPKRVNQIIGKPILPYEQYGPGGGSGRAYCSDSDGGLNYTVFGTVSGNLSNGTYYSYDDYCLGNRTLKEQFCSGRLPRTSTYTCPGYCSGGTCVGSGRPVSPARSLVGRPILPYVQGGPGGGSNVSCYDSDGGMNYTLYGFVTGYLLNGDHYWYGDSCAGNRTLTEWYCVGTKPSSSTYTCPGQCSNGQCVYGKSGGGMITGMAVLPSERIGPGGGSNVSCHDSDGGMNYTLYGFVSGYNQNGGPFWYGDSCAGNQTLKEWYCQGTKPSSTMYTCPGLCSYGQCVFGKSGGRSGGNLVGSAILPLVKNAGSISSCTDTDHGRNYLVFGQLIVIAGGHSQTINDSCVPDGLTLNEGYCYGSQPKIEQKSCSSFGYGYRCIEGKCSR